jgi:hypothetical protein
MKQIRKEIEGTEINSVHSGGKKRQTGKKRNTQIIKCKTGKENKYTKKEYRKKKGLNKRKRDEKNMQKKKTWESKYAKNTRK